MAVRNILYPTIFNIYRYNVCFCPQIDIVCEIDIMSV